MQQRTVKYDWMLFAMLLIAHTLPGVGSMSTDAAHLKPNIVFFLTDDQGYGDLGCYGSKTNKTPRMDQLAEEGTRFTNFYAQHVCGPSRSALLTGRYPLRSKGWNMPAEEVTFAELIREVGYQTACIGKWDVSSRKPIIERMPNAQGFDYYFGTLGANDGGHVTFHENNEVVGETTNMGSLITMYTDRAIDYLKNNPETTNAISKIITDNKDSIDGIMKSVLGDSSLTSAAVDWIANNPEMLNKVMKLAGM